MGKDITDKKDKKERKEKKEKKEKRASLDGVTKVKKDKKKRKSGVDVADALEAELNDDTTMIDAADDTVVGGEEDVEITGALVPFAVPLAEDAKEVKRILKCVKKCESSFLVSLGGGFVGLWGWAASCCLRWQRSDQNEKNTQNKKYIKTRTTR